MQLWECLARCVGDAGLQIRVRIKQVIYCWHNASCVVSVPNGEAQVVLELVKHRLDVENNFHIWVRSKVPLELRHQLEGVCLPAKNCKVKKGEGVVGTSGIHQTVGVGVHPLDEATLDPNSGKEGVKVGIRWLVLIVVVHVVTIRAVVHRHCVVHQGVLNAAHHALAGAESVLHCQVVAAQDEPGAPTEGPRSSLEDVKDVGAFEHPYLSQ